MKLAYKIYASGSRGFLKRLYLKVYSKLFLRGSRKLRWLRMAGMKIGKGTEISPGLGAFPEPFMITLGENVYISANVQFLTHDGSLSWMSRKMGYTDKRTEKIGPIAVKDNCFIGYGATVLHDVTIGKNSIVAACAVVTKDVPEGSVVGGCPAKVLCTTQEFLEKNAFRKDLTCGWSYGAKRAYYEEKLRDKS